MEYVQLGLTELQISRIGFGCWAMGGHGWGKVDDSQSVAAVHQALDLGINFFDTADVYGFGHSEEILSKALGNRRHDVIIATKFGVTWDEKANIGRDISANYLTKALESSLKRLRIDCIPLYQIHWPDHKTPIAETMAALIKCQEAGKIRYIGCSNLPLDLLKEASNYGHLESLQLLHSLIDSRLEDDLEQYCLNSKVSLLTYGTLGKGLFSGKYDLNSHFTTDDTRHKDPNFQGERFAANLQLVEHMQQIGKQYQKTSTQIAIRWALDDQAIASVITGIKQPEQILENAGAVGWHLLPEEREFLTKSSQANALQ